MASRIITKKGSGAPLASDLVHGELAVDTVNKRLYTEDAGGTVIEVGTNPSTIDINAGTIDGTVIGGSTAAAGTFTTGQFNTSLNVDGTVTADGLTVDGATDGTAVALLRADNNSVTKKNTLRFEDTDTTTQNDQQIGRIEFYSNDTDHTGVDAVIEAVSATTGLKELRFLTSDTANTPLSRLAINKGGDISFYEDTGTTAKFFWDASAESLGIGTSSPAFGSGSGLEIEKAGVATLRLQNTANPNSFEIATTSSAVSLYGYNTVPMVFGVNNAERMRIDASGNLLVGGSSTLTTPNLDKGVYLASQTNGDIIGYSLYTAEGSNNRRSSFFLDDTNGVYGFDTTASSGVCDFVVRAVGAEKVRVSSSGNVGIGTSSPYTALDVSGGTTNQVGIFRSTDATATIGFADDSTPLTGNLSYVTLGAVGNNMVFNTNLAERMRIDSAGNVLVGTTVSTGFGVYKGNENCINAYSGQAAGTGRSLFTGYHSATSSTTGTLAFKVSTNGNVTNINNSYGAISDIKLKENIIDATPKLDKLNQVRVVNFNMIGSEQKQIGVIAQELEQVFPSMVEESPDQDAEGNDLGTTTKSVKYSVFVPMLIKAMQEQQAIIESLTARIEALEGAN